MRIATVAAAAALLIGLAAPAFAGDVGPFGTYTWGSSQSGVAGQAIASGGGWSKSAAFERGFAHGYAVGDPAGGIDTGHHGWSTAAGQKARSAFQGMSKGGFFAGWKN
jgi:hypothetical protein